MFRLQRHQKTGRAPNVQRALRTVLRTGLREFLSSFCAAPYTRKQKGKKISEQKHSNKDKCELTGISNGGGVQQIHARAGQR